MITLQKATNLYLSTVETEGKSPRYIEWLRTRLKFFNSYIEETYGADFKVPVPPVHIDRQFFRDIGYHPGPLVKYKLNCITDSRKSVVQYRRRFP
jgi:hypothetical protein